MFIGSDNVPAQGMGALHRGRRRVVAARARKRWGSIASYDGLCGNGKRAFAMRPYTMVRCLR